MNSSDDPPVLIVGAGPAGVSAAIWLADFGVPFDWIDERGQVGGILHRVHNRITDYPGAEFDDGPALAISLREQLERHDLRPRNTTAQQIVPEERAIRVEFDDQIGRYEQVILATGTAYRHLGVPGEAQGLGDYVSQSAAADAERFGGRPVAVVGGGDAGFENALRLADEGCSVTLLLRNPEYRARPAFVDAVESSKSVDIAPIPSIVRSIEPIDDGCRLNVEQRGESVKHDVAALFVRIGVDPVVPGGCDVLATDDRGFLIVDECGRTSDQRIFAIGDIVSQPLRSVATAVGSGATCAQCCADELGFL